MDFVDNYDATMKEPTLFPVTFPTVLVNANTGIAVGMASNICSFNLAEVCETTIAYMRDEQCDLHDTLKAPDFSGGGFIVYRKEEMDKIYETGRGGFKVRARYRYDPSANCIDVTEIPPTTSCEQIIEKIVDLVKQKKITEISDIRDETGLDGMKLTIDLKRGVDAEKLMLRLFKMTPLEDTFSCNFNVLIAGSPQGDGRARVAGRMGGLPYGMRPPPGLLRYAKGQGQTAFAPWPGQNPARYRQGGCHHPRHRVGRGGCPQPDDRVWHR